MQPPQIRDEPQDELDAVQYLRAHLKSTALLASVLLDGQQPRRGRTNDDREAYQAWQEDAASTLAKAQMALDHTEQFSLAAVVAGK